MQALTSALECLTELPLNRVRRVGLSLILAGKVKFLISLNRASIF